MREGHARSLRRATAPLVALVLLVASGAAAQDARSAGTPAEADALRRRTDAELAAAPILRDADRRAFELGIVTAEHDAIDLTWNHLFRGSGILVVMRSSALWLAFGTILNTNQYPNSNYWADFGIIAASCSAGAILGTVMLAIGETDGSLHRRRALAQGLTGNRSDLALFQRYHAGT